MRFTIKLKLTAAFTLLTLLMVGAASFGALEMSKLSQLQDALVAGPAAQLQRAQTLNVAFMEIVGAQRGMALAEGDATLKVESARAEKQSRAAATVLQAGLSAARDGLFMEGPDSPYVNAIVARDDNKDSKKIQELKAAFQTSEVAEKAKEVYKGDAIKGW